MKSRRTFSGRRVVAAMAVVALSTLVVGCGGGDDSAEDPVASSEASKVDVPPRSADLIELAEPADGAKVTGSFEASGKANSPEANVQWEILEASSGEQALEGLATAEGWMDKLYPWQVEIDVTTLTPGDYVFIARTDDTSDGEGKPVEEVGTRITIE